MNKISRRTFTAAALAATAIGLVGCGSEGGAVSDEPLAEPIDGQRTLVAYFSVPLTDDPENMNPEEEDSTHVVDSEVFGNTEYVAGLIADQTGADVFRIERADDLPLDYDVLEDQARDEQAADLRPELAELIPNLDDYDTVFVGYPIWLYGLPMALHTFFEEHDLSGKTIIPFATHGTSGPSGTFESLAELAPGATVSENGFSLYEDEMDTAEAEVASWLGALAGE